MIILTRQIWDEINLHTHLNDAMNNEGTSDRVWTKEIVVHYVQIQGVNCTG